MKKLFVLAFCVALGLALFAPATASARTHPTNPTFPTNPNPPASPVQSAK